jgi:zinc transport system substrate-binding protein
VVDEARANDVRYIFFETLVSDKVARVVAEEIGAQTLVLNPFEGLTAAQVEAGEDYISIMRQNLANLRLALECR